MLGLLIILGTNRSKSFEIPFYRDLVEFMATYLLDLKEKKKGRFVGYHLHLVVVILTNPRDRE